MAKNVRTSKASEQQSLFGLDKLPDPPTNKELLLRPLSRPVWTENKAELVERYIRYFILVTKHGTYIDGFAGPQNPDHEGMWTAERVLGITPRWMTRFFLCDLAEEQCQQLCELVDRQPPPQPKEKKRKYTVLHGDFNERVDDILSCGDVDKGAVFCLLDQRTFQCRWQTLEKIARHAKDGHKIEVFYFLAQGWLDRALAATTVNENHPRDWWGRDDWRSLRALHPVSRAEAFCKRFREDLGYTHVKPWPIYENTEEKRVMYFMIHASDHDEAPKLMWRAYSKVHEPPETDRQLAIDFGMSIEPD